MSDSGRDNSDTQADKNHNRMKGLGFDVEHNDDSGRVSHEVPAMHRSVNMAVEMVGTIEAAKEAVKKTEIRHHSGNKYLRRISPADGEGKPVWVDVYAVIEAFGVTCPARQHALKKLLCAGLRGKGSQLDDLQGVIDSMYRAIELQKERESERHDNRLKEMTSDPVEG